MANTLQEETEQPCVTAAALPLCLKPPHGNKAPHTCADAGGMLLGEPGMASPASPRSQQGRAQRWPGTRQLCVPRDICYEEELLLLSLHLTPLRAAVITLISAPPEVY